LGVEIEKLPMPDEFITEELMLNIGDTVPEFLFTPGHTPGEYCIYFEKEKFCLTGDVLFKGNIGRTDLWGGDYRILFDSIKQKLFTLPDDTLIYPGHGENSEIGFEKRSNPFLVQSE
jgi:glyoxylase-like metal-dependent hydrolase (beta-lactamase superfamily II)